MANRTQGVFDFLACDPLFQRQVREERVVAAVKEALTARLRDEAERILRDVLTERLEETVGRVVSEAVQRSTTGIQQRLHDISELVQLLADARLGEQDDADWWKRGPEDE